MNSTWTHPGSRQDRATRVLEVAVPASLLSMSRGLTFDLARQVPLTARSNQAEWAHPRPQMEVAPTRPLTYHPSMGRRRERGQGLAEYALLLSLIAIIAIAALVIFGREISAILSTVGTAI